MTDNGVHQVVSFKHRLASSFSGGAFILLLAGGFALYLMDQMGTAVKQVTSDILPKTLIATRLSEHSALLAASAPSLTNATDWQQTNAVAAKLDQLKAEVVTSVAILEEISESDRLGEIRAYVITLTDTLLGLKTATNERIVLGSRQAEVLARIRAVHSELVDTVSPVVWGVSSLTRLFGKRAARASVGAIKTLHDRYLPTLVVLLELQSAYRDLISANAGIAGERNGLGREAFDEAWRRVLAQLGAPAGSDEPAYRRLLEAGANLYAAEQTGLNLSGEPRFDALLTRAAARARSALAQGFADAEHTASTSVSEFVDKAVRDMGYALNIKAEGNLLFALLTAVAEADTRASVASLQDRFNRSRDTFQHTAVDFQNSSLALRNPILANSVTDIEKRLRAFGEGADSLFEIRRDQLRVRLQIDQLLANNRAVAAQLNREVERLVNEVQTDAANLGLRMEKSRGAKRLLLILVFLVGLILLGVIAAVSIRVLDKQDREIRQAATVFESTGEGIVILDPHSRVVAVNEAFIRSSGYQRGEIVGRHVRVFRSRRHDNRFYKEIRRTLVERGRWQGEIYTRKKNGDSDLDWLTVNVVRDTQGNISQTVAVFSDVEIVKRSLEQLDHLAHHDTLTGLPNRLLLRDRLDHAVRRAWRERRQLAVLFLDLDRFKNINDTLGHTAGDNLLRVVSARLSKQVREGDTVARLGGDEFMVLLEDYRSPRDARIVAQKVLDSFHEPFVIHDHELFITASIGISVYPGDGMSVDELIRNSDAAMYRAKEEGKNNYQFYTSDLTIAAREKLRLESSLRLALARDEFELYYQPKWNAGSGVITGVEALLRWRHPEYGLVGPVGFLSALEDCGLILPLGKWVLRTACQQAQVWHQQGLATLQMAVNISGRQIAQGDLLATVKDTLTESGLDPRCLELEITEGFVMEQPDEVIVLLTSLRDIGVSIAIDDFGTGYSSLNYLKQLPIQKLKIDRSFVRDIPDDPDDVTITSAIIALGHRLQMSIVAEGVETEAQLEFLKREGCDEAQGYLVSTPLPADELSLLLQRGQTFAPPDVTTVNA